MGGPGSDVRQKPKEKCMKITVDKFNEAFERFAVEYLVPHAEKPATLFKIGYARAIGRLGLDERTIAEMKGVGVIGPDGSIDIDLMKKSVMGGVELSGGLQIEKLGVRPDRRDVEMLFRLVETGQM